MPVTKSLEVVEKVASVSGFLKQQVSEKLTKNTTTSDGTLPILGEEVTQEKEQEVANFSNDFQRGETPQESEIVDSYDGDSDSGDESSRKSAQNLGLAEDFMHDVESEIVGDDESPEFQRKSEDTVII